MTPRPRKRRKGNWLSMGFSGKRPASVTPAAWRRKIAADLRADVPRPDIQLTWRNSPKGRLMDGDLATVVAESRREFVDFVIGRLEREATRMDIDNAPTPTPARKWSVGDYSRAVAAIRRRTGATPARARATYARLVKILGHRGVRASDVDKHPRLTARAAKLRRRRMVRS